MEISLPCSACNSSEGGTDTVQVTGVTGSTSPSDNETPHLNICVRKICETKNLRYFYPHENENIWKETQSTIIIYL